MKREREAPDVSDIAVSDITATTHAKIPHPGVASRFATLLASVVGIVLLAVGAIAVIATMGALVPFIPEWLFWTGTLALLLLVSWLARVIEEALLDRLSGGGQARPAAAPALATPELTKI